MAFNTVPLYDDLWVDKQEMHLEEGEKSLENWVSNDNVIDTVGLHGGMHSDLQADEDQCPQAKNC